MTASFASQNFTVPKQGRAAVPLPDPSAGDFVAQHIPGSDLTLIQHAGSGQEVLSELIECASQTVYNALKAARFTTGTLAGWPVEGGGTVSFSSMTLMSLGEPRRYVTTPGGKVWCKATWWRQATSS